MPTENQPLNEQILNRHAFFVRELRRLGYPDQAEDIAQHQALRDWKRLRQGKQLTEFRGKLRGPFLKEVHRLAKEFRRMNNACSLEQYDIAESPVDDEMGPERRRQLRFLKQWLSEEKVDQLILCMREGKTTFTNMAKEVGLTRRQFSYKIHQYKSP